MGLYDTLVARARCPHCEFEFEAQFQTKALGSTLEMYRMGDVIETEDFVIKDVTIRNCIEICERCNKEFYADFSAKNGRLQALLAIRKRET
ncbi:MAG: hypothetical protein HYZ12_04585 [Thaumarchaeota archaeon]|nr:hypothetical protein [Nitrososphaerota archaeon]